MTLQLEQVWLAEGFLLLCKNNVFGLTKPRFWTHETKVGMFNYNPQPHIWREDHDFL